MALDVRLCRDEDEPWGFELFGGADEEIPLTIEKIQPDSPAKRAGLLNGDTVLTINGEEAIDWSLKTACRKVAACGDNLTVGVMRGLYDPVLDDYEPIYDYEPDGLDQPLEPTEVPFKIQNFVEPSDIGSTLIEVPSPIPDSNVGIGESRSLTASPFVPPTKPYRPFSTEPILEVPPLEDPIILNPNYRDEFGKSPADANPDYILNAHYKNELNGLQGRFKLPISEQYDPDGTRFVQNVEVTDKLLKYERHVKSLSKDLEIVDVTKEVKVCDAVRQDVKESLVSTDVKKQEILSKDVKFEGTLQEEINIEKKDVMISEGITSKDMKHEEFIRKDIKNSERKEIITEDVEEKAIREEMKYIEKMRQEMDLEKIEETALTVVEDSIERAVSVAEEIKKEIEEEISSSEVENVSEFEKRDISKYIKSEKVEKSSEIKDETEISETKKERKISNFEDIENKVEKRESREEIIDSVDEKSHKYAKKDYKEETLETSATEDSKIAVEKSHISEEQEETIQKPVRKESVYGGKAENKGQFKQVTETVTSDVKKGAEQRAYNIGLQTIPNIRGVVHSSYHYDLLLRTFFLHLTDVMVALSRFVLTQPIFNVTCTCSHRISETSVQKSSQEVFESQKVEKQQAEKAVKVEAKQEVKEIVKPAPIKKQEIKAVSQRIEKGMKVESIQEKMEEVKPAVIKEVKQDVQKAKIEDVKIDKKEFKEVKVEKVEAKQAEKVEKEEEAVQVVEKTSLSGAQMAQRTEKKLSQEMTEKMDAVISEFQTIAVEEDVMKEMLRRNRRSRSRSQIEEEVLKEGDPLEWLSKVDKRRTSQVITEMSKSEVSKTELSSTELIKKLEKIEQKQETKVKKPKTPKQTYVAVVEAHVYTNKDAIFEEQVAEFSETSSVQSAEEINTAFEAIETHSTENVALESAIRELETAKVIEESHELATVTAKSAAIAQNIEELTHESKEFKQEEYKKETALQTSKIQEVLIQETKEIVEPVVEMKENKIDKMEKVAVDINESLTIAESTEISVHESKSELSKFEMKEESVAVVEEEKNEEKVNESKAEIIEPKPVQIEEITETVTIKLDKKEEKPVHDEYAALKIIKKIETEGNLSPEIIEIEDISEDFSTSKLAVSQSAAIQQLEMDSSKQVSETSIVSSKMGMAKSEATSVVDISKSSHISSEMDVSSMSNHSTISKHLISGSKISEQAIQESSFTAKSSQEAIRESSFTAKSADKNLTLKTNLERQISGPPSTIDTPTPSTVPPTPLTDEYVFKLSIPLPKSRSSTPVPRDSTVTPEDEDPHIVKKKLIPHIETTIEKVVYDPPLPTPSADKVQSPVYTKPGLNGGGVKRLPVYRKPGLFGGADRPEYSKEEIREIERKSSLLASAIDETIKSIEEYKEEVGIETKKEVTLQEFKEEKISTSYHESYSKDVTVESTQNGFEEIDTKIEEIMENCEALAAIENHKINDAKIEDIEIKQVEPQAEEIEIKKESIGVVSEVTESEPHIDNETQKIEVENKIKEAVLPITVDNIESKEEKLISTAAEYAFQEQNINDMKSEVKVEAIPEITVESKIEAVKSEKVEEKTETSDVLPGFRPVVFDPEAIKKLGNFPFTTTEPLRPEGPRQSPYMTETGEVIGTIQGIVDGLEDPVMDAEVAKELGKPGISEEKIAELISGEAEMLREAHVMGLSRVLTSHMHRADDSSVDFQKIKPMLNSLKDSEVLKALNEELMRQKEEERKKEEKRWTTFLQKPKRPVPKAKFGYHGWTEDEKIVAEPYKVKIVKQAKPKVAPDYKPEDFDTGPLPWEERANTEASLPPVEPEEPILIPEVPEFLEAVDPLGENEVPDLEDTGIPLPPPKAPTPQPVEEELTPEPETLPEETPEETVTEVTEEPEEKKETREEMDNRLAEQLVRSVQGMVDPNASVEQQLAQMRAQLAALAQLPEVIQQSLQMVSQQLNKMTQQEAHIEMSASHTESRSCQQLEVSQHHNVSEMQTIAEGNENAIEYNTKGAQNEVNDEANKMTIEEIVEDKVENGVAEQERVQEQQRMQEQENKRMLMTPVMTEEELRMEKQKKEQARLEHEARQIKNNPTPRATKPKRMFGPLDPEDRPVVLPGGRRWRKTQDVYDEAKIAETLQAQSELIQGKAMGFESAILPFDDRINFMKYEKPPISLDHLKHSEVYKLVHDMDQTPLKRVEMRTPAIAEADYRERCRSMTPAANKHLQIPQQFHP